MPVCGRGLVDQALEAVDVAFAPEHRIDRGRGVFAELLLGRRDVEDAALGAHAETVAARAPQRRERKPARHLL